MDGKIQRKRVWSLTTGKELKARRKKLKLKAYQLAEILGVTATTISNYERGVSPIPLLFDYALYGLEVQIERGQHVVHVPTLKLAA